ncbi:hypothetical protein G4Y79_20525 [Phototrophicus methaneseepsis]|uniref:PKD/Chitinase domain-containing protein n=1 Tax=Phototrophicus methaneseepsis TaxID=2710758 RepID=A0A7S8E7Y3_9CHLR|nr:PKD domain-containing protein [Phototrophicus methaneseepsis]QPC82045.1 hypothetical protein G4Y79_20525 [Phototrophicus methaneseepsis]
MIAINIPVTVVIPPVADAGNDQVIYGDSTSLETVLLDGSNSIDEDGIIVNYNWAENSIEIATGVSPQIALAVGIHTITLTVTDVDGLTNTDTITITVFE